MRLFGGSSAGVRLRYHRQWQGKHHHPRSVRLGVPAPLAVGLRAPYHVLEAVPAEVCAAVCAVHVVAAAVLLDRAVTVRARLHVHPGQDEVRQFQPPPAPARAPALPGLMYLCSQSVDVPGEVRSKVHLA